MLQFNATLCASIAKTIPKSTWRVSRLLSSATKPHEQVVPAEKKPLEGSNNETEKVEVSHKETDTNAPLEDSENKPTLTSVILKNAKSSNDYLNIVQNYQLTKQDTFKIMASIMHLINAGDIKIEDMLTDKRFEKLQQSIAAMDTVNYNKQRADIAVKYGSLSTVQMIKVVGNMVREGEKNIDVMKFLADQILQFNARLSPDNCKDLLSYMVSMKFQHKALTNKICKQLITNSSQLTIQIVQKVVTSLGLLKYKDNLLLDVMCTYMLYYKGIIPPNDLSSVLLTFATLGYNTSKVEMLIKKHVHPLTQTDFTHPVKWFHLVWSLAVLNMAERHHYETVLTHKFLSSLKVRDQIPTAYKMKLLNIKAAAKIEFELEDTNVEDIVSHDFSIQPSPYWRNFIEALDATMKEALPSEAHYKLSVNSGMGFCIDAVCYTNSEGKFVLDGSPDIRNRIAIILLSLAEYTRGEGDLVGTVNFQERLLKAKGYTVVPISEKFFSPVDTAPKRLMYLKEEIMKAINLPK